MHKVVSNFTGLTQYTSLKRVNCRHWIEDNTNVETEEDAEMN